MRSFQLGRPTGVDPRVDEPNVWLSDPDFLQLRGYKYELIATLRYTTFFSYSTPLWVMETTLL